MRMRRPTGKMLLFLLCCEQTASSFNGAMPAFAFPPVIADDCVGTRVVSLRIKGQNGQRVKCANQQSNDLQPCNQQTLSCSRRHLILLGLQLLTVSSVALKGAHAMTNTDEALFYSKWPYTKASDILPFIYERSKKGDIDGILAALDEFGVHYPMYKLGDEKGKLLEEELSKLRPRPKVCIELGTFFGYSALRTAKWLDQEMGKLYCIEFNPDHAEVASKVIEHAGLEDKIEIFVGAAADVLPKVLTHCICDLHAHIARSAIDHPQSVAGRIGHADFVLLDHAKEAYLPDLLAMEAGGLVGPGTLVAADNVVYPGAPGFLEHVQGGGKYETRLAAAKFEYDLVWKAGWSPKQDALSFSYCLR